MASIWKKAVFLTLFASAACSRATDEITDVTDAEIANTAEAAGQAPSTTAAADGNATADQAAETATAESVLAWSRPAARSTVSAPVNELVFHFSPSARLVEVTVTGPEGTMPMMVTAAGEAGHYSLPVSGWGQGRYTVEWRASARGVDYRGSFGFQVR